MVNDLLNDGDFNLGFKLKGLNSIRDGHEPIKAFSLTDKIPEWYLCQWNSRYNLKNGKFAVGDDEYNISDKSKSLTVVGHKKLIFKLNAGREYDAPRKEHEPWPHLLIEQEITENNRICDFERLICHGKFRLLEFESFMNGAEREYHTAQFVWVVTLKDDNPESPSYNRFIWVVLCPFDSRYEYAPLHMNQDVALPDGEFIYSFSAKDFLSRPLWDKDTVTVDFDLMPHIDKILSCAQDKGFMIGSKADDLIVSSTNMGFEVTGTFLCKISAEDIRITAVTK